MKGLFRKRRLPQPALWGASSDGQGVLHLGGCSTLALAQQYGTPLHVCHEQRLADTARNFLQSIQNAYPGHTTAHYAFKCNSVPGIVEIVKDAGLRAEVMSLFELKLALALGYQGKDIIVNGPFKPDRLLRKALESRVRLIVADSLSELERIESLCNEMALTCSVLLRVNPDVIPRGMNQGSATGSRKGCAFGLDLKGGEVETAIHRLPKLTHVKFRGFHFHIGTGIVDTGAYLKALAVLAPVVEQARLMGMPVDIMDVGGGLASPTSREMTSFELLRYFALGTLPGTSISQKGPQFDAYARAISAGITGLFDGLPLPELILEPGRCIASPNQLLLLTVHQRKRRRRARTWLITDGGIGTVTMPTYYECHEVLLCNDVCRELSEVVTIAGPGCFAADVVYHHKTMPGVTTGEILAIMDSGAYFTSWESTFGFPRPAIVGVKQGTHRVLRSRETFAQMIARDRPMHPSTDPEHHFQVNKKNHAL